MSNRIVTVELTREAEKALVDGKLGTVQNLLYDFLNLAEPEPYENPESQTSEHLGMPVVVFPGDLDGYFALSVAHASLCASGATADEAESSCFAKISELQSCRDLTRAELMACKTLGNGLAAVRKLKGKQAVVSLAMAIESSVPKELCKDTDSCYLLASRLAATLAGTHKATQEWAEANMLKYPTITTGIEQAVSKLCYKLAKLAERQERIAQTQV